MGIITICDLVSERCTYCIDLQCYHRCTIILSLLIQNASQSCRLITILDCLIICWDWSVVFRSSLCMYNVSKGSEFPDSFLMNSIAYVSADSDDFKRVNMVGVNPGCGRKVWWRTVKYELNHCEVVVMVQDLVAREELCNRVEQLRDHLGSYVSCSSTS